MKYILDDEKCYMPNNRGPTVIRVLVLDFVTSANGTCTLYNVLI